ncbi:MAG: DUF1566 domain-containing protein [Anaerolineaceae bacterium]|nr:DUF1566 domain-containing protein [Anaerolineaceae bacterium]
MKKQIAVSLSILLALSIFTTTALAGSVINLPKTHLTTCMGMPCPGSGQDGEYQAGVAWPSPRFTNNGDGTLTDRLTGLTWMQDVECLAKNYRKQTNIWPSEGTYFADALQAIKDLNDGKYPLCDTGHYDWRMPNIRELFSLSLLYKQQVTAQLNAEGFINMNGIMNPISSTTVEDSPRYAYAFFPDYGNKIDVKTKEMAASTNLWPVRGISNGVAQVPKTGQTTCYEPLHYGMPNIVPCGGSGEDGELQAGASYPARRFTDNADGTITDQLTGLMWLKDADCMGGPAPTGDAYDFITHLKQGTVDGAACGYVTGKYNDWRLPNLYELYSLVDYKGDNVARLNQVFSHVRQDAPYFSSSRNWYVHLYYGTVDQNTHADSMYVLPVRGGIFADTPPTQPVLYRNFFDGKPGSVFFLTGHHFKMDCALTLSVNGFTGGDWSITTSGNGELSIQIGTDAADPGIYNISTFGDCSPSSQSVSNPWLQGELTHVTASTTIHIDPNAPLRAVEGDGLLVHIPAGIAMTNQLFIPLVKRP